MHQYDIQTSDKRKAKYILYELEERLSDADYVAVSVFFDCGARADRRLRDVSSNQKLGSLFHLLCAHCSTMAADIVDRLVTRSEQILWGLSLVDNKGLTGWDVTVQAGNIKVLDVLRRLSLSPEHGARTGLCEEWDTKYAPNQEDSLAGLRSNALGVAIAASHGSGWKRCVPCLEQARKLIEEGVFINRAIVSGQGLLEQPAFVSACQIPNVCSRPLIELLVSHGCDTQITVTVQDGAYSENRLNSATVSGWALAVTTGCEEAYNTLEQLSQSGKYPELAAEYTVLSMRRQEMQENALRQAAGWGQLEDLQRLLQLGTPIDTLGRNVHGHPRQGALHARVCECSSTEIAVRVVV